MIKRGIIIRPSRPPAWWWMVLVALAVALLASCTTTKTITEYRDRIDHRDREVYHRDTICIHDSVFVRMRADTVYYTRWRTEYREVVRVDTIALERVDSVCVEVPVYIERKLSPWERLKLRAGGSLLWLLLALLVMLTAYYIIIVRRR